MIEIFLGHIKYMQTGILKIGLLLACGRWFGVLFFQGERDSVVGFVDLKKKRQTKFQKKQNTVEDILNF